LHRWDDAGQLTFQRLPEALSWIACEMQSSSQVSHTFGPHFIQSSVTHSSRAFVVAEAVGRLCWAAMVATAYMLFVLIMLLTSWRLACCYCCIELLIAVGCWCGCLLLCLCLLLLLLLLLLFFMLTAGWRASAVSLYFARPTTAFLPPSHNNINKYI
jgi:uncharacterized Tic20 family protein